MNLVKLPTTRRSSFKNVSAKLYFLFVAAFSVRSLFANHKAIYDTENFFEITSFLEPTVPPGKCQCLDCEIDKICGGLWRSNMYHVNERSDGVKIHVVVAHCVSDLTWLATFSAGHDVASFHITSKCGNPVIGAPAGSIIKRLPNVGRCDHSYVNFITKELDQVVGSEERGKSIIVFLKDDISLKNLHQSGRWKTFEELINMASSPGGFACGITPDTVEFGSSKLHISSQHDTKTLMKFSMPEYHRNLKGYTEDKLVPFLSSYATLGEWMDFLNPSSVPEIVEVCYGGVFAVSATNIKRQDDVVWRKMEESLSRGNNIQEGHFAERMWAGLLRTPLRPFEIKNLRQHADGVYLSADSMHGALFRMTKVYFHVGLQVSASTELLAKSFIENKETLKDDGYSIAVHGKWDGGHHGFPNVDRLASCMWSAEIRSKFPSNAKEAASCPSNVLSDLTEFLYQSVKQSKDVVISNPWLAHPGTADSLAAYLDSGLDAHVVLYYRRYFEWISDLFKSWRDNLRGAVLMPEDKSLAVSSLRYIDFLREHCKRLFSTENTSDDALSVFLFLSRPTESIQNGPIPRGRSYLHYFEQKDVKGLIDETEYTYFVAKQYSSVPRFHNRLTVVNLHDIWSPETNFYCDVLPGAKGACEQAARTDVAEKDVLLSNTMPGMDPQLVFEDIVLSAYSVGKLRSEHKVGRRLRQQILRWEKMILRALQQNDLSLADFPTECLYPFEVARLLQVSLEYEKELLPEFFESSRGGKNLEQEFGKWKFCSVNTHLIVSSEKWNFLFDDHLQEKFEYKLFKPVENKAMNAVIHIGPHKTGSTSIQEASAAAIDHLQLLDKYETPWSHLKLLDHGELYNQVHFSTCFFHDDNPEINVEQVYPCRHDLVQSGLEVSSQNNHSLLVSAETFSSLRDGEIRDLHDYLNSAWNNITIAVTYRRYYDYLVSFYNEWVKNEYGNIWESAAFEKNETDRFGPGILEFLNDSQHVKIATEKYSLAVILRYQKYFRTIVVMDFHDDTVDLIEQFYCHVLPLAPNTCQEVKRILSSSTISKHNKNQAVVYEGLTYAAHRRGIINVRTKKQYTMIRDAIHIHHEKKLGLSINDFPLKCPPTEQLDDIWKTSLQAEKQFHVKASSSLDITSNSIIALKDDFDKRAKTSLCDVNFDSILESSTWKTFFDNIQKMLV